MDFLSIIIIIGLWIGFGRLFKPADPPLTDDEIEQIFYNKEI